MRKPPYGVLQKAYSSTWRKNRQWIIGTVLVVLLSVLLYTFSIQLFTVKKIVVSGTGITVKIDEEKLPKNLLFFPVEKIEKEIKSHNPQLEDVRISKVFPSTLHILVTLGVAVAILKTADFQYALDSRGFVIGDGASHAALATIDIPLDKVIVGQKIEDERVLSAIALVRETQSFYPIESITIYNSTSLQARFQNVDIFFPVRTDVGVVANTLQTLFDGFRIKGRQPTVIDLRFDKPVVTF